MDDIATRFRELVAEELGVPVSEVVDSATFTSLGADSLDLVELLEDTEKAFNIAIPVAEAEKLQTVGEAIAYIEKIAAPPKGA